MENSNIAYKGRKKVTDVKSLSNEELRKIKEENKIAWDQFYKGIENKEQIFNKVVGLMFFVGSFIITKNVVNGDATFLEGLALFGGEFAMAGAAFGFDKACSVIKEKLMEKVSDKKYGPALEELERREEAERERLREEERLKREKAIKAIDEPVDLTDSEKDRINSEAQKFIDEGKDSTLFDMEGVKQFIEYTLHNEDKNRIQIININDDGSFDFKLYHCDPNTPLGFYFSNRSYYSVSYCNEENEERFAKIEKVQRRIFKDGVDVTEDEAMMKDYMYNPSDYSEMYIPVKDVEPIYLNSKGLKLDESRGRKL